MHSLLIRCSVWRRLEGSQVHQQARTDQLRHKDQGYTEVQWGETHTRWMNRRRINITVVLAVTKACHPNAYALLAGQICLRHKVQGEKMLQND